MNQQTRVFDNITSKSIIIPTMAPLPKTHKPRLENGDPKTRCVVFASGSVTKRAEQPVCTVMRGALEARGHKLENCSTEDVLHNMEEAGTNRPEDFKKRTSGFSMDVTSGYNSLDINKTARIVGDAIGKTPVDYPSFRPRPAILYIQAAWEKEGKPNIMQERGLGHLYIERHSNRGRKPTIYNHELTLRPMAENKEECEAMAQGNPKYSSLSALPKEPTKEERRKIVGLMVETNLRAILKCNIYTFGGNLYHQ